MAFPCAFKSTMWRKESKWAHRTNVPALLLVAGDRLLWVFLELKYGVGERVSLALLLGINGIETGSSVIFSLRSPPFLFFLFMGARGGHNIEFGDNTFPSNIQFNFAALYVCQAVPSFGVPFPFFSILGSALHT